MSRTWKPVQEVGVGEERMRKFWKTEGFGQGCVERHGGAIGGEGLSGRGVRIKRTREAARVLG